MATLSYPTTTGTTNACNRAKKNMKFIFVILSKLFYREREKEREREREKNTKESQPQPLVNILHFYIMQIFCHLCTNQYQN